MDERRRRVLGLVAIGISGVAGGCTGLLAESAPTPAGNDETEPPASTDTRTRTVTDTETATETETTTDRTLESPPPIDLATSSPQFQYDAVNSGYNPDTSAPRGPVTVSQALDQPVTLNRPGNVAVVGDVIYLGAIGAYSHRTGERRWAVDDAPGPRAVPAVVEDTVYAVGRRNNGEDAIAAISRRSASIRWERRLADTPRGHPSVVDGRVYTTDFSGTVYAFSAEDGDELWTLDVGERSVAPVASNGDLAVTGGWDGYLYGLDANSGEPRWRVGTKYNIYGTAIVDGTVFATTTYEVLAVDAASGDLDWRENFDLSAQILTVPAVADGRVYVADRDGNLHALDATSGQPLWQYSVADRNNASSPVVAGDTVVVGSKEGRVAAVDRTNGAERWIADLPNGAQTSTPVVADGTVFVTDGILYTVTSTDG